MTSPPLKSGFEPSRPLNVVHVCRVGWPHRGGMESVVGGLSAALAKRGHAVRVITLDRGPDGRRLVPGIWGGVPYVRLPRVGPRSYPMARGLTARLRGADVVHVHGLDGLLKQAIAGRAAHGARVGVTPHGGFLHTHRRWWIKQIWLRTGASAALRRADAVWFTSAAAREALRPAGVEGEILPDGVDVDAFSKVVRSPTPGRWVVFGRLDRHKGLEALIDRLAAVAQHDDRPFRLRIIGPEAAPGLLEELRARAVHHGIAHRLTFCGALRHEDLLVELARCELAFFPSRFEAFGVALVEAMAAGVPVVVNAIPAFRELVTDGRDGIVLDFSRSEASRKIRTFRGHVQHLSGPAREVAAGFGWERRVLSWEEAYRALVCGDA
ncbi:MAG: glycosyltransferase family 1 protein [Deltaproteobacteria bacterium]|nr:MAG: glycosyltransferase family 1 protein [Deltaproteobacteria bacterium]